MPNMDDWSSKKASEFITKINAFIASKPALATDKQVERIGLYIKAGLLTMEGIEKTYKVKEISKLQKKDASDICEDFEPAYRVWRDEHVTEKQIEYINSLNERLGDPAIPADDLMLMTRKTASALIEQLEKEWKNRAEYSKTNTNNYKDLTDRSKEFEERMKLSISEREFDEKIRMCNKLYVMIGQEPEGLESVGFNEIDEFLTNLIDFSRMLITDEQIVEGLGLHELSDIIPQMS